MVGDLDDHKISSVQNFRPLGEVEPYKSYNGVGRSLLGRELGTNMWTTILEDGQIGLHQNTSLVV